MSNHIPDRPSARSELSAWYEAVLDEQQRSGLSISEFADLVGVTATTLYSWRRQLSSLRGRDSDEATGLVQVRVRSDEPDSTTRPLPMIVELVHGVRVEVPRDFDSADLARLVAVLEAC